MIFQLRNKLNQTIVDIEVYTDNNGNPTLSAWVEIETYSKFLIDNLGDNLKIIRDFSRIQYMKSNILNSMQNPTKEKISRVVRERLKIIGDEYNLSYVED